MAAVRRYTRLRQRARANSMAWWLFKLLQGALIGVPLTVLGILIALSASWLGGGQWLTIMGILVVLAGLGVVLRYALAPITCRWIVIVPEGYYWVVEDGNGFTLRFLASGPQQVDWNWNVSVKDYVNFTWVSLSILERNVLPPDGPVNVEVGVTMRFDPSQVAQAQVAELRALDQREKVERLLARATRNAVRDILQRRSSHDRLELLGEKYRLEQIIMQRLASLTAWGLFPIAARPVSVFVEGLPQAAYDAGYDVPYVEPPEPQTVYPTMVHPQPMEPTIAHEESVVPVSAAPEADKHIDVRSPDLDPPAIDDIYTDPMTRRSKWKKDKRE